MMKFQNEAGLVNFVCTYSFGVQNETGLENFV